MASFSLPELSMARRMEETRNKGEAVLSCCSGRMGAKSGGGGGGGGSGGKGGGGGGGAKLKRWC